MHISRGEPLMLVVLHGIIHWFYLLSCSSRIVINSPKRERLKVHCFPNHILVLMTIGLVRSNVGYPIYLKTLVSRWSSKDVGDPLIQKGKRRQFSKDSKVFYFIWVIGQPHYKEGSRCLKSLGSCFHSYTTSPPRQNFMKGKIPGQGVLLLESPGPRGLGTGSPEWRESLWTPQVTELMDLLAPRVPNTQSVVLLEGPGPRDHEPPGPRSEYKPTGHHGHLDSRLRAPRTPCVLATCVVRALGSLTPGTWSPLRGNDHIGLGGYKYPLLPPLNPSHWLRVVLRFYTLKSQLLQTPPLKLYHTLGFGRG
jgi:hypothetical protein